MFHDFDFVPIVQQITDRLVGRSRVLVGIAGPPGAGKTTFAAALEKHLTGNGILAKSVPMDGFHLDNTQLDAMGLRARKGAPETFDARGFVDLVTRLKGFEGTVSIPGFDRVGDCVIPDHETVRPAHTVLLIEGNYLFLKSEPWNTLRSLFDLAVFINPGIEELERRLIQRWLDHDHSPEDAKARALSNDIPNARRVLENLPDADFVIT